MSNMGTRKKNTQAEIDSQYVIVGTYKETGKRQMISRNFSTKSEAEKTIKAVFQTSKYKKIYKYVKACELKYAQSKFPDLYIRHR